MKGFPVHHTLLPRSESLTGPNPFLTRRFFSLSNGPAISINQPPHWHIHLGFRFFFGCLQAQRVATNLLPLRFTIQEIVTRISLKISFL